MLKVIKKNSTKTYKPVHKSLCCKLLYCTLFHLKSQKRYVQHYTLYRISLKLFITSHCLSEGI